MHAYPISYEMHQLSLFYKPWKCYNVNQQYSVNCFSYYYHVWITLGWLGTYIMFDVYADWPKMQNFVLANISYMHVYYGTLEFFWSFTVSAYKLQILASAHKVCFKPKSLLQ